MRIGSLAVVIMIMAMNVATANDDRPFPIGVAKIDFTPELPIRLGGYLARTTETREVHQTFWAKAPAIGSDRVGPSVLVSVDNLGVSDANDVPCYIPSQRILRDGGYDADGAWCITGGRRGSSRASSSLSSTPLTASRAHFATAGREGGR